MTRLIFEPDFDGFQLFYFNFGIFFRNNRSFEFSHAGISFFKSDKRIAHCSIRERINFIFRRAQTRRNFSFNKTKMFVKNLCSLKSVCIS